MLTLIILYVQHFPNFNNFKHLPKRLFIKKMKHLKNIQNFSHIHWTNYYDHLVKWNLG